MNLNKYLETANATADCALGILAAYACNGVCDAALGRDLAFTTTAWVVGGVAVAFNGLRNGLAMELSPALSATMGLVRLVRRMLGR